jgi:hypothetical protein
MRFLKKVILLRKSIVPTGPQHEVLQAAKRQQRSGNPIGDE